MRARSPQTALKTTQHSLYGRAHPGKLRGYIAKFQIPTRYSSASPRKLELTDEFTYDY